jgi:Tol biopolymer transport system component
MRRQIVLTLLLALALPATGASAASLPAGTTAVISGTPDLLGLLPTPVSDSSSTNQAVDDDGGRIVFSSDADGLMAGDDDDVSNVYVKDVATGAVELVSRATDGQPSHVSCRDGVISGNGMKVAFVCGGSLDPADQNGVGDVYLRDLTPGAETTKLVSRRPDGRAGDGDSDDPAIDGTGRFVAFRSDASDIGGAPQGSRVSRIFRREIGGSDAVGLASVTSLNVANDGGAFDPSISDNGVAVAFDTIQQLTGAGVDPNAFSDVYVHDFTILGSQTSLVSLRDKNAPPQPGLAGNGSSFGAIVSADGQSIAFTSRATNLEAPPIIDDETGQDVYVRQRMAETTTLVSRPATQGGDGDSTATGISNDGLVVGFVSEAKNLDPADASFGPDGYVSVNGRARLVSQPTGTAGPASNSTSVVAVSGDGKSVVLDSGVPLAGDLDRSLRSVVRRDLDTEVTTSVSRPPGAAPFVNAGGSADGGSVSADGRYVAFTTTAPALGSPPGVSPVVVRDVVTGAVTVVSREDGEDGAVLSGHDARISADGRRVAFVANLDGNNSLRQVLVRDIASGRTFLVSRADGDDGEIGNQKSEQPSISDDGSRVAFVSDATNLDDGDDDTVANVHLRKVDTGETLLVDRADGAMGAKSLGEVGEAVLSGDGRHVVFDTDADNLLDSDRDAVADVYVRDVEVGSTQLASVNDAGTKGNSDSERLLSISRDGNRVSFFSEASNLGAATPQVYVRDIGARTLQIAARADGLNGSLVDFDREGVGAALSADGQHLAFVAVSAASIVPGVPGDALQVYERDLASGATRLISRRSGLDGAPTDPTAFPALAGISADGGCVAFVTSGRLLPGLVSTDYVNVYMRAVTADCGRPPVPVPPVSPPSGGRSGPALLSGLSVRPARFHVGGRRGGTRISFRLDRASGVTLAFERLLAGHRKGKRCSTRVRRGRRCTVARRIGRLTLKQSRLRKGANSVKFSGKLGRKALVPGRYRLTATPSGGKGRSVTVTVVKAPTKRKGH